MQKQLFLLILIIISGCSKIDLAFDYAPRIATGTLDKFFDFKSQRYDKIKESIAADLKNSKVEFKEKIIKKIDEMLALADKAEINERDFADIFFGLRKLQAEAALALKPSFDELVLNLTDEELKHFKKESGEAFDKYEDLLKNKEKFKRKALDGFERNMKMFFNSVEDAQRNLYLEFVEQNFEFYGEQLKFRREFLKQFEVKFANRPEARDYAYKFYSGDDSVKPAEYVKKQDEFFRHMFATTHKIWLTLNAQQKKDFKETLVEIKEDLKSLK